MVKYNEYNTQIQVANTKTLSHINLYSKENYTEDEFKNIILEVFKENREDLILYDLWELYSSNLVKDYFGFDQSKSSIKHLGESTYPNKYKYINSKKLTELVIKKYPQFSKEPETTYHKFSKIIIEWKTINGLFYFT